MGYWAHKVGQHTGKNYYDTVETPYGTLEVEVRGMNEVCFSHSDVYTTTPATIKGKSYFIVYVLERKALNMFWNEARKPGVSRGIALATAINANGGSRRYFSWGADVTDEKLLNEVRDTLNESVQRWIRQNQPVLFAVEREKMQYEIDKETKEIASLEAALTQAKLRRASFSGRKDMIPPDSYPMP